MNQAVSANDKTHTEFRVCRLAINNRSGRRKRFRGCRGFTACLRTWNMKKFRIAFNRFPRLGIVTGRASRPGAPWVGRRSGEWDERP